MPDAGWYPDPGGRTGHFRYWDGQTWAPTTSPLPSGAAGGGGPTPPGGPGRRRRGPLLVGAAVVLVLVVVGVLAVHDRNRPIVDYGPAPSTSAPSTAEPSPTEEPTQAPTSASPTPGTSPRPGGEGSQTAQACLTGNPFSRQDYPRDGRVHGGSLSFRLPEGWTSPSEQISAFTWAYDVGAADVSLTSQRSATFAVGAVSVADGFEDPRTAAELMMRCTLASDLYRRPDAAPALIERQTDVQGYPAFTVAAQVPVDDPTTTSPGDTVSITVVDLDSPEALAFFWGSAPIGDPTLVQLEQMPRRLRVG